MKIISLYHIKGGVGKTAAAVNLAFLAARTGAPTLLADLDPQGSATFYFRIQPKLKAGVQLLEKGKKTLHRHLRATDFEDLDVLPADENLRKIERFLLNHKSPKKVLAKFLEPLKADYEYVFLDCPPNLSLVAENVFNASSMVITPVIPTVLSSRTHDQLSKFIDRDKWRHLQWWSFISMMDRRKNLHRETAVALKNSPHFLETIIPSSSEVEKMGIYRMPLPCYNPSAEATKAYRRLWWEIEKKLITGG